MWIGKSGQEVLALLTELHAETGMTVVLVTHDGDVAATTGRRIEMRDGKIKRGASLEPAHAQ